MTPREQVEEWADTWEEELLLADGFDDAIIGLCQIFNNTVVAYDRDKCIKILSRDAANYGEAVEYFEHNVIGSFVGPKTPAFITPVSTS